MKRKLLIVDNMINNNNNIDNCWWNDQEKISILEEFIKLKIINRISNTQIEWNENAVYYWDKYIKNIDNNKLSTYDMSYFEFFNHSFENVTIYEYKSATAMTKNNEIILIHGQKEDHDYIENYLKVQKCKGF